MNIEHLRFEHTDRLEPAIALLSGGAATPLDLKQQVRQPQARHTPAKEDVPLLWVAIFPAGNTTTEMCITVRRVRPP